MRLGERSPMTHRLNLPDSIEDRELFCEHRLNPQRMNIDGRIIWQQAAGDGDRNYVDICISWGVILCGPGYNGPYSTETALQLRKMYSARKVGIIRTFKEDVKDGHLVVLRMGTNEVHAVGEVVGEYQWSSWFGDVDGWDAEHVRRVRWLWVGEDGPMRFPTHTLKWGNSTQELTSPEVKEWLRTLEEQPGRREAPLPSIEFGESAPEPMSLDAIAEHMFDLGASSASIERLTDEVDDLVRIYTWYSKRKENWPSEHETVAYLVVPFLRALGWTPQKMAVEWGTLDVALFNKLPRTEENLACIVEVKNLNSSCLKARAQAEQYTKKWGRNCRRFVVTDGMRYGIYERDKMGETFELRAYMNLGRRFDAYPVYGDQCMGIRAAIMAITPERIDDPSVFEAHLERQDEDV